MGVLAAMIGLLVVAAVYGLSFKRVDPPDLPGALVEKKLVWEGRNRSLTFYMPSPAPENPPLVFVFHGSGGDAATSRELFGFSFERLAQEQGFIVAYPDGFERHFNGCRRAGPYAANELQVDDVGFIRMLAGWFATEYGVDLARVYATGVSNGGQMALRLALEAPDLVAGVAPIATSLPTDDNMDCAYSGKPVALLLMNGTKDPMNPYHGGTVALYGLVGDRGTVISSAETAQYWARLAGHTAPPEVELLPDTVSDDKSSVRVERWESPGLLPVAHYTVEGGGHNAPHPGMRLPRLLGATNNDIDAAATIMAFFNAIGE
jgi:polyhydroxybutyrate depolymerase